jgi:HAMP domain-containing protein
MVHNNGGLRIFPKLLLSIVVPTMVIIGAIGLISYIHLQKMSVEVADRLSGNFVEIGKEQIKDEASEVANEVRLFIRSHPGYSVEDLQKSDEFRKLATQRIGQTGYTALVEKGTTRMIVHPDHALMDVIFKDEMLLKNPKSWRTFEPAFVQEVPKGDVHDWPDADGRVRQKYFYCLPIRDTKFIVVASTDMDELLTPLDNVRQTIKRSYRDTFFYTSLSSGLLVFVLILIVFSVTRRLTHSITKLVAQAEAISLGNFDVELDIKSRDEIGELAEAINRMRLSLRTAIDRLRRRR